MLRCTSALYLTHSNLSFNEALTLLTALSKQVSVHREITIKVNDVNKSRPQPVTQPDAQPSIRTFVLWGTRWSKFHLPGDLVFVALVFFHWGFYAGYHLTKFHEQTPPCLCPKTDTLSLELTKEDWYTITLFTLPPLIKWISFVLLTQCFIRPVAPRMLRLPPTTIPTFADAGVAAIGNRQSEAGVPQYQH